MRWNADAVNQPDAQADPTVPRLLRWESDGGLEHATVATGPDGYRVEGVVVGPGDEAPFGLWYHLVCDDGWRTRGFEVRVAGTGRHLLLRSDGGGSWRDGAGRQLVNLSGCLDVDLTATPLTNTLPIRRLGLAVGGGAVVRVAYVDAPALSLSVSEQRYTRIGPTTYRFELTDGSFARDIVVDDAGFVADYPGLFRRQRGR